MPTPTYSLPYPAPGDPPNGPVQFEELAQAVEDEVVRLDNDLAGSSWTTLSGGQSSGWSHNSDYRIRGGVVTIQVDVQRTSGAMDGNNIDFGTVPSGFRPSRAVYGTCMNQQQRLPFTFEVGTTGEIKGVAVAADTNERIRGLINYPV